MKLGEMPTSGPVSDSGEFFLLTPAQQLAVVTDAMCVVRFSVDALNAAILLSKPELEDSRVEMDVLSVSGLVCTLQTASNKLVAVAESMAHDREASEHQETDEGNQDTATITRIVKRTGVVHVNGCRYTSKELAGLEGERVTIETKPGDLSHILFASHGDNHFQLHTMDEDEVKSLKATIASQADEIKALETRIKSLEA